jgi:hypothetical protein
MPSLEDLKEYAAFGRKLSVSPLQVRQQRKAQRDGRSRIGTHIAGSTRSSHLRTSDEVIGEESRNPSHSDDEKVQRHPTLGRQRRRRVRTDLRHRVITLVKQSYAI